MRTTNVQEHLDTSDVLSVRPSVVKRSDQYLERGDILISSANSWNLVGKCSWVPDLDTPATFGGFVTVLRADPALIDKRYLYRWFSSSRVQAVVRSFGRKTTNISNLDLKRCQELPVPMPPLREQRRIAGILDATDLARVRRRKSLSRIAELRSAIFLQMFGDPMNNAGAWHRATIGDIGVVITGNTPTRERPTGRTDALGWVKSDNLHGPGIYVTRPEEVVSRTAERPPRMAGPGAILVTCIAGSPSSIGNLAITDREVAFNQQINAVIPSRIDSKFLYSQLLLSKRRVQSASTGGMKGLVNKTRFSGLPVIDPPIALQEEFASRFDEVEERAGKMAAQLAHLDALFDSLQHRAFAGEL